MDTATIGPVRQRRSRMGSDGEDEHARPGPARDLLRCAAEAADRARGDLRPEAQRLALALWRGLVDGRWSVVDRFASNGRRYLVARQNRPWQHPPHALTPRERQVVGLVALGQSNKVVAYALGITDSAVSTHLSAATRKLTVCTRCELVALAGALCTPIAQPAAGRWASAPRVASAVAGRRSRGIDH